MHRNINYRCGLNQTGKRNDNRDQILLIISNN